MAAFKEEISCGRRLGRPSISLRWRSATPQRSGGVTESEVELPLLWSFAGHDGFDGATFGLPDEGAQLEQMRAPHGDVPAPTSEDALVLYHRSGGAGAELIDRLRRAGTVEVTAGDSTLNPYWPRQGAHCLIDPDGYRLIVVTT